MRQHRSHTFSYALAATMLMGASCAHANVDGSLDSTFVSTLPGVPGLFRDAIDLGGGGPNQNQDVTNAIAVQADGAVIVAGSAWNSIGPVDQYACVIARFTVDGQPDTDFHGSGQLIFNFSTAGGVENSCVIASIAVQPDGKILAAGNRWSGGQESAVLFRFNADGSTDSSFASSSPHPGYIVLDDGTAFSQVLLDRAGNIYGVGRGVQLNASDYDFFVHAFDASGLGTYFRYVAFDRGGDLDDRAAAAVLQHIPGGPCGPNCQVLDHDELYLVGSANGMPYGDMPDHDCAVAAFRSDLTSGFEFVADTQFGIGGKLSTDFPVSDSNEGDNFCRVAVSRTGSGTVLGGYGVVVGGENFFISTLGGGTPGMASTYALAEIDGSGNVTREDAFAFFQEFATPGIYNGIFGMLREPGGKIVATGYASTTDANRAPSDVGVIRFNADYTRDSTFGNDGLGLSIVTLDEAWQDPQREWGTALAIDGHGRILLTGERSFDYMSGSNDYDWLVARLLTSDVILRDGFDGVVPAVR